MLKLNMVVVILALGWLQAVGPLRPAPEKKLSPVAQPTEGVIEVTKQDFTKMERLRSTALTTFGIRLGDSLESAEAKAAAAGLKRHVNRDVGLVTWRDQSDKEVIAFHDEQGRVVAIIWYGPMAARLAGRARELFHDRLLDRDDPVRLELLGREDKLTADPLAGVGTMYSASYDREGLRIFQSALGGPRKGLPIIHLVAPAKAR